jgi:hypothetical protein
MGGAKIPMHSLSEALEKSGSPTRIMKTVVAFLLLCGLQLAAQDVQSCPMHREHQADVEKQRRCGDGIAGKTQVAAG